MQSSVGSIFPYTACLNSGILNILHIFDLLVFSFNQKNKKKVAYFVCIRNAQETILAEKLAAMDDIPTKLKANIESIHLLNQQVKTVRRRTESRDC